MSEYSSGEKIQALYKTLGILTERAPETPPPARVIGICKALKDRIGVALAEAGTPNGLPEINVGGGYRGLSSFLSTIREYLSNEEVRSLYTELLLELSELLVPILQTRRDVFRSLDLKIEHVDNIHEPREGLQALRAQAHEADLRNNSVTLATGMIPILAMGVTAMFAKDQRLPEEIAGVQSTSLLVFAALAFSASFMKHIGYQKESKEVQAGIDRKLPGMIKRWLQEHPSDIAVYEWNQSLCRYPSDYDASLGDDPFYWRPQDKADFAPSAEAFAEKLLEHVRLKRLRDEAEAVRAQPKALTELPSTPIDASKPLQRSFAWAIRTENEVALKLSGAPVDK
ncbi:MAG: hypothetical protein AAB383_02960 [Patescibacteria group bacterium]